MIHITTYKGNKGIRISEDSREFNILLKSMQTTCGEKIGKSDIILKGEKLSEFTHKVKAQLVSLLKDVTTTEGILYVVLGKKILLNIKDKQLDRTVRRLSSFYIIFSQAVKNLDSVHFYETSCLNQSTTDGFLLNVIRDNGEGIFFSNLLESYNIRVDDLSMLKGKIIDAEYLNNKLDDFKNQGLILLPEEPKGAIFPSQKLILIHKF